MKIFKKADEMEIHIAFLYNPSLALAIRIARLLNKPVEMIFVLEQN
ncbi:MAG: hypothetical protein WC364_06670 [Eubacteriales bacterium]